METRRGLNVIEVSGQQFLLTATAGDATHLTGKAADEDNGQAAIPDHYVKDFERTYDMAAIMQHQWAESTLCGRQWILMEGERDGEQPGQARCVPSCRRCLTLLDRLFPPPKLNDSFPVIVQVVADTILEYGTAEIFGVPGDQQSALRKEVRAEVKKRMGYRLTTYAHESMVIFVCDPIYDLHADEHLRRGAEALNAIFSDKPAPQDPPTRLSWATWASE